MTALDEAAGFLAMGEIALARERLGAEIEAIPASPRAALILAEAGLGERAEAMAAALDEPARSAVLALLHQDETLEVDDDDEPVDLRAGAPAVVDASVSLFIRFFGGRRDLYARQWFDERRRRGGYHPVEAPLTEAVVARHLRGVETIGQYLLRPDGRCAFGVIDLDLSASAMGELRAAHGDDVAPARHAALAGFARNLLAAGRRLGVRFFAEDSGNRGIHLWCFLDPPRPARALRAVLQQVVVATGSAPPDVGVELYPKQDHTGPRGLSSLVKLPLGVHLGSGRRCPLLDDALAPIDDVIAALRRLEPIDPGTFDAIAGRQIVALPAPEAGPPAGPVPPAPTRATPRSLGEVLRAIEPGDEEKRATDAVIGGCSVLGALVARAYRERKLDPDEARAVTYTLGLLGPSARTAEETLAAGGASVHELQRARRGLPSPTGCGKLRNLARDGASCTGCAMDARALPYPTPVLFATGSVAPARPAHAPLADVLDGDGPVVQSPADAVFDALRRIEGRLERLERDG